MSIKKYASMLLLAMMMSGMSIANAAPDLVVTSVSAPVEMTLGDSYVATVTMANQGSSDVTEPSNGSSVYYSVYLSFDDTYDSTDICAGYGGIFYQLLTAGSIQTGEINLQVNAENTPAGSYYLIARADAICELGDNVAESDETNNSFTGETVVVNESNALIDLTMTNLIGPGVAARDVWYRLDTYITNLGPDAAPGRAASSCGHYTAFYLSTDVTITSADLQLGRICHNSLAGGDTLRWYQDVMIPASVPRGAYYWGVVADDTEILGETDEANNTFVSTSSVRVR